MTDRIKRFIDCYIPITGCTLRCHYCYITMHRLFNNNKAEFNYSPAHIRQALSRERLGGTCLLNLCGGGETLLPHETVELARELLEEGHYVMIVTNATLTARLEEIAQFPPELTKHLFFKFSYHYLELKKRNLLDRFFSNIRLVRDAGCSFTVELTPNDELIPYIEELKQRCIAEVGAPPHVTIARDERDPKRLPILTDLTVAEFYKTWETFDTEMLRFKKTIFEIPRREFCYAGAWSAYLHLGSGEMSQCYRSNYSQNIFQDITKPIRWLPIGRCKEFHCYNGHAWLTLGDIPEIPAPTYADLRNRTCRDGSEWLRPEMRAFMSTKTYQSNATLSSTKQRWYLCLNGLLNVREIMKKGMQYLSHH